MNKQQAIAVATDLYIQETLPHAIIEIHALKTALEYAYDAGQQHKQQAPAEHLYADIEIPQFNTSVRLYDAVDGAVILHISTVASQAPDYDGLKVTNVKGHQLDVKTIDNVELMTAHFEDIKVGVFMEVMKLLGAYHTKTIVWDNA